MNTKAKYICPKCKSPNDEGWPIHAGGEIKEGGCQDCWEADCSKMWWEQVRLTQEYVEQFAK